ncbi:MAG: PSD1 domain-containing protein [Planctomycetia bacterium]|nr:PSD1 domain-containing protein [Planctomycetia bacterium]
MRYPLVWIFALCLASLAAAPSRAADGEKSAPAAPQPAPATKPELPPPADREVDFAGDIQPLLARSCYSCHGPDKSESSLRLDRKADALAGGASGPIFEPGKSAESRLVAYIAGVNDEGTVMPPEGQRLSAAEIALVRAWIDQGARWPDGDATDSAAKHWSFQPIRAAAPPPVARAAWVRNGIDAFVLARLEAEGIDPSPEADRPTLIRRLHLDLLGLPPSPADVEEFIRDNRPDAYEQLVERLLASPHYGERWARHWLDLARYADSDGYEKDSPRPHAWRFRNWVIDALNRDLPFDRFTIQQLAGDLLPDADLDTRVATGFHRNTLLNKEGGVDQEEFRVAATIDRVNTTGTVWLGLTIGCAQCHTHKYDPIPQREYYGLFAFFNSLSDVDLPAPLPEQVAEYQKAKASYDVEHAKLETAVREYESNSLPARQAEWEKTADPARIVTWTDVKIASATSAGGAALEARPDGSVLASSTSPATDTYTIVADVDLATITGLRLEALADESLPANGPGRAKHGNFVLSELRVTVVPSGADASAAADRQQVKFRKAVVDFTQKDFGPAKTFDGDTRTGWAVAPQLGRDHTIVFALAERISGPVRLVVTLDQQRGEQHTLGRFRLSVTSAEKPLNLQGLAATAAAELAKPAAERSPEAREAIAAYYRQLDPELDKLDDAVSDHAKQAPVDPATTIKAQAFSEIAEPRKTHVLVKGDFLRLGADVAPHTLSVLPPLTPRGERPDRLDLARWLVDPVNPLTGRVTVNRVWQRYFGRGLVATSNDFGTQGEKPTHPELLDWLAREFMRLGWSQKALDRLIVTSATYRQSSASRPELAEHDPYNTLLARQNRNRVEAEVVRDLALAASGILNPAIGGPSVRPVQPAGIAELIYAGSGKWEPSKGTDRHRRGLYTFFQRTAPYPMLMTFDAPDSNTTCTRRERSNTPLQALTLLNDPVFVECAQGLARRIVRETTDPAGTPGDTARRVRYAFLLCLGREPTASEVAAISQLYESQRKLCQADAGEAGKLTDADKPAESAGTPELAAWVVVGRTLMNTDEFITRE